MLTDMLFLVDYKKVVSVAHMGTGPFRLLTTLIFYDLTIMSLFL